ncbi:hypothetical protein Tco_1507470 [Tanacetum coccineum]
MHIRDEAVSKYFLGFGGGEGSLFKECCRDKNVPLGLNRIHLTSVKLDIKLEQEKHQLLQEVENHYPQKE